MDAGRLSDVDSRDGVIHVMPAISTRPVSPQEGTQISAFISTSKHRLASGSTGGIVVADADEMPRPPARACCRASSAGRVGGDHSITSSARASNGDGRSRPRILAVLRLM